MQPVKNFVKSVFQSMGFEIRRKPRPRVQAARLRETLWKEHRHYHLGCGPILIDGFLNIDDDCSQFDEPMRENETYRLPGRPQAPFIRYDLRHGIPAPPASLQTIYHSHFFEHLTEDEGIALLGDCRRSLAPGGLMRMALPDLELWCRQYVSAEQPFFDWYRKSYLGDNRPKYTTRGAVFAGMLYNWGHHCAYDFESLAARLRDAGFTDVERCAWGQSRRADFVTQVERPEDNRAVESLVVEAICPP